MSDRRSNARVIRALQDTHDRLAQPGRWQKDTWGTTRDGKDVTSPEDALRHGDELVTACLEIELTFAAARHGLDPDRVLEPVRRQINSEDIPDWNDRGKRQLKHVLSALRYTIAALEAA